MSLPSTSALHARLAAHAPSLLPLLQRRPSLLEEVLMRPLEQSTDEPSMLALFAAALGEQEDSSEFRHRLRWLRHRELVRIALREIEGLADVDTSSAELAALAAAAVEAALAACQRSLESQHGVPTDALGQAVSVVVLGMGKLGGGELNFGSDVDLCFFYASDEGELRGTSNLSVHAFFAQLAARTTQALAEITEDGFCFRVDLRLRPEGARGPLVNSLASTERYYEAWGRTWERAALLRARPIGGDRPFGNGLLAALQPFIYRREVRPSIADEMAVLLANSRRQLGAEVKRDIKLGIGGIREAEFFVQTLQLVWGGVQPSLRVQNTLLALRRLLSAGLVTHHEATSLEEAWALLRRLEHRIHMRAGYQTHRLPAAAAEMQTLAKNLELADAVALQSAVDHARQTVTKAFCSLQQQQPPADDGRSAALTQLCDEVAEGGEASVLASALGQTMPVYDADEAATHLLRLSRPASAPFGALGRQRLPELAPLLLEEVAESAHPEAALRHLADFFQRLGNPSSYGKLLHQDAALRRRLLHLFGTSHTLSAALIAHPESLDQLLTTRAAPTDSEIIAAHDQLSATHASDDEGTHGQDFVAALRVLKRELTLQTGLAYLASEIDLSGLETRLSQLAEQQVRSAFAFALQGQQSRAPSLVAVALGKLGSRQMGFGSDLDLIFLHTDSDDDRAEDYTRAARQVLRLLSQTHAAGRGYAIDTRLRPDGTQGLLLSSVRAFGDYQRHKAAPWERQALLHARPIAGPATSCRQLEPQLLELACSAPPSFQEIAAMRGRIERQLSDERSERRHLKYGYGGLLDVEFAVQALQLQHAAALRQAGFALQAHPALAIELLSRAGLLTPQTTPTLKQGYDLLRRAEQVLRLFDETREPTWTLGGPLEMRLARALGFRPRAGLDAAHLWRQEHRRTAESLRNAFESLLAPVGTSPPWHSQ